MAAGADHRVGADGVREEDGVVKVAGGAAVDAAAEDGVLEVAGGAAVDEAAEDEVAEVAGGAAGDEAAEEAHGPTSDCPFQELRVSTCDPNVAAKPQCSFVCDNAWQEGRGSLFLEGPLK